jgi:DNA-binding winged helix-turn-helix (wHTH) protein/tetratricopeptide (TPR) repeat protein
MMFPSAAPQPHPEQPHDAPIDLGHAVLDLSRALVHRGGEAIELTDLETRLLRYLVAARGAVVSSDELLLRVWGYSARVESRAPALLVTRLRRKVELKPSEPTFLLTAYGQGFRVALPERRSALIGRSGALAELTAALASPGARVLLHGRVGIGKSALLHELAARGWRHIRLEGARSTEEAALRALGALGLSAGSTPLGTLQSALSALPEAALLLDGADALPAGGEGLTALLGKGGARVLIARRAPWELEGWRSVELTPLRPEEGAALLRLRLTAMNPDPPAAYEEAELRALSDLLLGNPLAIEVAARRAAVVGATALRETLERAIGGPARAMSGDLSELELLTHMHDAAWSRLGETERRVLRLAAWPGCPSSLAELLDLARRAGWSDVNEASILRVAQQHLLERLADHTLTLPHPADVLVRQKEAQASDRATLEQAAIAHAVAEVHRLSEGLWTAQHGSSIAGLSRRGPMLQRAASLAGPDDAVRIGIGLAEVSVAQKPGIASDDLLSAARRASTPALRMLGAQAAARLLNVAGAPRQALSVCEAAIAEHPLRVEDPEQRLAWARLAMVRGTVLCAIGRVDEGSAQLRRLLDEVLAPHDHWHRGNAAARLAAAIVFQDVDEAQELYIDALGAYKRCGATTLAASAQHNYGILLYDELETLRSLAVLTEAEATLRTGGELLAASNSAIALARAMHAMGERAESWRVAQSVLNDVTASGWRLGEQRARSTIARLLEDRGDHKAALNELKRARHLARNHGFPVDMARTTVDLAWFLHRRGDPGAATPLYREVIQAFDGGGPGGIAALARLLASYSTEDPAEREGWALQAREQLRRAPRRVATLADDDAWPGLTHHSWEARAMEALRGAPGRA